MSISHTLPGSRYVIIEGISSYHPNIAHYYDYKVWAILLWLPPKNEATPVTAATRTPPTGIYGPRMIYDTKASGILN